MMNQRPILKNILFILLNLLVSPIQSQIAFDFENQNLSQWFMSNAKAWDTASKDPLSGNYSLKHVLDTNKTSHDQISYPLNFGQANALDITWTFLVRHAYNPSADNNWNFFLMANNNADSMFNGFAINAYVIGVNLSGSDDSLRLWKVTNGKVAKVLSTGVHWERSVGTNQKASIKVHRSFDGWWEVSFHERGKIDSLRILNSTRDTNHLTANHVGVLYKYTATHDMKLWIDDILIDTLHIKPIVKEDTLNNNLNKPAEPNDSITTKPAEPDINFIDTIAFVGKTNNFKIFDVLVTEIMVDPEPTIGLPVGEYIELFNRTADTINLKDWRISIGSTTKLIPEICFLPNSYLVICHKDLLNDFLEFGKAIGILTSSTTLTNTGQTIRLLDNTNKLIHQVAYSDTWYNSNYKAQGGWSLEMVDVANPCNETSNWQASIGQIGGTPGVLNSVAAENPDVEAISISQFALISDSSIRLVYSEYFDSISVSNNENYIVSNIGNPSKIVLNDRKTQTLIFDIKFQLKQLYTLSVTNNISDCVSNTPKNEYHQQFAIPETADSADVIINEVLFDAFPYSSDFVEIYNRSSKTLDAGQLLIALENEQGVVTSTVSLGTTGTLLFPKSYLAVTENIEMLRIFYKVPYQQAIFSNNEMISLPDKNGRLILMRKNMSILDRIVYNESMHIGLISNKEGVSLERLNPDFHGISASNWHSAASTVGWATPGYKNSQYLPKDSLQFSSKFKILNDAISPDNDGVDDILNITYQMPEAGYLANIVIFDAQGKLIRKLENTALLSTSGSFTWDGTFANNQVVRNGIYIFYFEIYNLKGNIERFKKVCVVARKY